MFASWITPCLCAEHKFFVTYLVAILLIAEADSLKQSYPKAVDWAYSPVHIMLLANFEAKIYNAFKNNNITADNSTPLIDWWIKDYEKTSLKATKELKSTVETEMAAVISNHPFLTFRMMKRYAGGIPGICLHVEKDLTNIATKELCSMIETFQLQFILPNYTTVANVIANILELQFMYDLNSDDLLAGKFGEINTGFGVSLEEAYEIGLTAYQSRLFPEALHWLDTVYRELSNGKVQTGSTLAKETVFEAILELTRAHDALIDTISQKSVLNHDHYHRFVNKINSKHRLVTLKEYDERNFKRNTNLNSFAAYSLLCGGYSFQTEIVRAKLHCILDRNSDLAWLINPLKIEVHNLDPYIVQIYDVIGDKLVQTLLTNEQILPEMGRGSIAQYDGPGFVNVSNFRTCSSAVLSEYDSEYREIIQKLDRKIGLITQLIVSNVNDPYFYASEQFKITTYAFGGQFYPHMDAFGGRGPDDTDLFGDRLATFMIYLNDVWSGGHTVFPLLGTYITPKKGSALFWYDLLRNGKPDDRTLHAGCPVLLGQKWIASKWIRQNANFQTRKCSLNYSE